MREIYISVTEILYLKDTICVCFIAYNYCNTQFVSYVFFHFPFTNNKTHVAVFIYSGRVFRTSIFGVELNTV